MRGKNGQFLRLENAKIRKLFIVKCPICGLERYKDYRQKWAIEKGKTTARCRKCSRFAKGRTNSGGFKKGFVPWNKGTGKAGFWEKVKGSKEWKTMRKTVFERDNYTCQNCGKRGGVLHPDHIKPKSLFPELMFEVKNIRTLCRNCHIKTDTYGGKARNYKK